MNRSIGLQLLLSVGALLVWGMTCCADPGSVDPAFQPPTIGFGVSRVAVQGDGKVLIAGGTRLNGSAEPLGLVRLKADGSKDPAWEIGTGFLGQLLLLPGVFTNVSVPVMNALVVTPAGVVVGGNFEKVNGQPRTNLVRLLASGAVDASFAPLVDGIINAVTPVAGNRLLIAGSFKNVNRTARAQLARLNADGSLDGTFNPVWGSIIAAAPRVVVTQADGKILVGGSFTTFSGSLAGKGVARLNPDGSLDSSFVLPGFQFLTDAVSSMVLQTSGKIVIAGGFSKINGTAIKAIARLNADGSLDTSWPGPGIGNNGLEGVDALVSAADGRLFVGGKLDTYNGQPASGIARLSSDGVLDPTFKKQAGATTFWVATMALQEDGKVLVGGVFTLGTTADSTKLLLRLLSEGSAQAVAPQITEQPISVAVPEGGGASFSVQATGTPPLAYQWQFNGQDLPFKTDPQLTIFAARLVDAGEYRVIVRNAAGPVTSATATLTVAPLPKITLQPLSLGGGVGSTATLTAGLPELPPATVQWFKDGVAVPGANEPTLTLVPLTLANAGLYYMVAQNAGGAVTSKVAQVTVYTSSPSWIVTSSDDGLGEIDDVVTDGIGGVLLAGRYTPAAAGKPEFSFAGQVLPRPRAASGGFVARLDDTGSPLWIKAFNGDASVQFNQFAIAGDTAGNVFVAGGFNGPAELGGLLFTNAAGQATFLAKLSINGNGQWARILTGNFYTRQLAATPEGAIVLSGRHTTELHLEALSAPANEFGGAAVAQVSSRGTPQWLRHWGKGATIGGSVDLYRVAADSSGIYVAGAFNQSIQFGPFSAALPAPPFRDLRWIGKLDGNGDPVWLQPFGGGIPTGLAAGRDGSVWTSGYDDALASNGQVVARIESNGKFTTSFAFTLGANPVVSRGISVDDQNYALTGGYFAQFAQFGSTIVGTGVPGDHHLFAGRFGPAGPMHSAHPTARNYIAGPAADLAVTAFTGNPAGDGYYAGHFTSALRFGTNLLNAATQRVFIAKVSAPGRFPFIRQQPAAVTAAVGGTATFTVNAGGDPTLTFQWLKNGAAIPGATSSSLTLHNVSAADVAAYAVSVRNLLGTVLSQSAPLNLGTPPGPSLSYTFVGGSLILSWPANARLQVAGDPASANWADLSVTSPFTVPLKERAAFYRLISQ